MLCTHYSHCTQHIAHCCNYARSTALVGGLTTLWNVQPLYNTHCTLWANCTMDVVHYSHCTHKKTAIKKSTMRILNWFMKRVVQLIEKKCTLPKNCTNNPLGIMYTKYSRLHCTALHCSNVVCSLAPRDNTWMQCLVWPGTIHCQEALPRMGCWWQLGPECSLLTAHCSLLNQGIFSHFTTIGPGLRLRAKFQSGHTRKTPFLRCFALNPLQIRGVTFSIANVWSQKLGIGTNFCQQTYNGRVL